MRTSRAKGRKLGGGELVSIAVQTAVVDVLASGEFCNPKRRVAHLLGMYGFILYLVATAVMVFRYSTGATATPQIWPMLWWIGALMVLVGGYWFWFFIRVDVAAEGGSPFRVMRADLFILSLLASVTLGLVWAWRGGGAGVLFWLYILATTVLFGSVAWSKFAHMFFKPAAAFEKRVSKANGTGVSLPTLTRFSYSEGCRRTNAESNDATKDSEPANMRSCPCSVGGAGVNRMTPRPKSTMPVTPTSLSTR